MSLGVGSLLIGELPQSSYVAQGQSAYEVAVKNGFVGTEQEWLQSLIGSSRLVSSATPPDWPENGLLWWNTVDTLSIYLSGMWMPISLANADDESLVFYGTAAPDPAENKIWLNTEIGRIFHYYGGTWVEFAQPGIVTEVAIGGGSAAAPEIEDIPGLRSELDGKQPAGFYAPLSHTHEITDVRNLQVLLSSKSEAIHTHAISDVNGLQTQLSSRAPLVHAHLISDVTGLQSAIDSKAAVSHFHGQIGSNGNIGIISGRPIVTGPNGVLQAGTFGNSAGTFAAGNDERLSDARVPLAHDHDERYYTEAEVNGLLSGYYTEEEVNGLLLSEAAKISAKYAAAGHSHGNITNAGAIGSTASLPVITGANGVLQAGAFGTSAGTFCQGNDPRLNADPIPVGAIMPFAVNSVPMGWLAANGAAVSRATYANLFAAINTIYGVGDNSTTFNLPDLRGYFVRGAGTNSDGTAAGAFGVRQADEFRSHGHGASVWVSGNGARSNGTLGGSGSRAVADAWGTISVSVSIGAAGGAETRPRNIAMLYCIKF